MLCPGKDQAVTAMNTLEQWLHKTCTPKRHEVGGRLVGRKEGGSGDRVDEMRDELGPECDRYPHV